MRIAVLFRDDLSKNFGPNIVLRNLILEWKKSNEVTLITSSKNGISQSGVVCKYVPSRRYAHWLVSSLLARNMLKRCDVVVDAEYTIPILLLLRTSSKRVVLQVHGNEYLEGVFGSRSTVGRFVAFFRQLLSIKISNLVIAVSRIAKENLVSYYGSESKIAFIENGVDLDLFHKIPIPKGNYFLFVGDAKTMFQQKGVPDLLKAFSLFIRDHSDISLVFVGEYDRRLKELSENLGLSSRVHCAGFVERSELINFYNQARALVMPSYFDSYSLATNEAMACGLPVIVSDKVGASTIVRDSRCGLVFRAGDHYELYLCLKDIIDKPELESELGDNAIRLCKKKLGWTSVAHEYLLRFDEAKKR